jgi:Nicotinate phosphoribosyltransferase (NAPRTase) N-terminal domain
VPYFFLVTMTGLEPSQLQGSAAVPPNVNSLVRPMLTDLYQLSMAYAYWDAGRHNLPAVFELYFRSNRMFESATSILSSVFDRTVSRI